LGGGIGFFVGYGIILLLSFSFPDIGDILMNPIIIMIIVVFSALIGHKIEENRKLTTNDVKEAVKGGIGITFGWYAFWLTIALVISIVTSLL